MPSSGWLCVRGVLVALLAGVVTVQAGLYSSEQPLVSLAGASRQLLLGSRSSWLAEFYASWCGHCINFSGTWKELAQDVKDWRPAVYLAVLDCAEQSNMEGCTDFGITGYPTLKFFKAFAQSPSEGSRIAATNVADIRRRIIDRLESQKESPPPACPPLEPISATEVDQFFKNNEETYLVLIFENPKMYIGREVALDMVQYEGVSVRRVINDQTDLVERYKVSAFPSGFLLSRNGSISKVNLEEETRSSYTDFLRSLPGVKRGSVTLIGWSETINGVTPAPRRQADGSKVYMADLESALHYSLRVEVARHPTLEGEKLKALTDYVKVLRKFFPARPMLRTLLFTVGIWLRKQAGKTVLYDDFEDVLNNKNQPKPLRAVMAPDVNYVWCQGSKPEFRGFPCSLWTLFHLLTVQASDLSRQGLARSAPQEVLQAMRGYVQHFFGCTECAGHFEEMAAESMRSVRSLDSAITWLWERHNRVNKRLAGAKSEDPDFPKIQWPTPELCPFCRIHEEGKESTWDYPNMLNFMKTHFAKDNINYEYLEDEKVLLENQRKNESNQRNKRDLSELKAPSYNEEKISLSKVEENNADKKDDKETIAHHRPSIIKMKLAVHPQAEDEVNEEIVDLDSFSNRLYPVKLLKDPNLLNEVHARHPETLLDPPDAEFDPVAARERLLKRGVDTKYLVGVVMENGEINWKGRWVKMLEVGFSRLDISLCVVLYFLSSMCLLIMYLYLSLRTRFLKPRCSCPQA
ncbi:sulfhydryl oxidase 1 [Bombina bombina]|uniref:sulfhydryl oxidase 1 n=1 Tax=Bombina bombina TaxID=8345 RepID=UPI00235A9540|nr:sulfhydryl oxidase 1 [Bombina bombina]